MFIKNRDEMTEPDKPLHEAHKYPFAKDLTSLSDTSELSTYLKLWHQKFNDKQSFVADDPGAMLERNVALVDAVLERIYCLSVSNAKALHGLEDSAIVPSLAIVATGGYGRCELAPHSDVDLTFVPGREDDEYLNSVIKDMFQRVMDVFLYGANLKVGYGYRYIGDLKELDHQTQTTLLDSRFLCGDPELFVEFRNTFRSNILTADFIFQKWAERQSVLLKHGGDIVYGVEPNLKEGAGGLRDIQTAEWIAGVTFRASLGRIWDLLVEREFLSQADCDSIHVAKRFLWRTRIAVHIVSAGPRDALTPEKQELVASMLGYRDTDLTPAVEYLMRDCYTQMATVKRISRAVVDRCLQSDIPIGLGLSTVDRCLVVADREAANKDPSLPLHISELIMAYNLRVTPDLNDDVREYLITNPQPADTTEPGRVFTRILSSGNGVYECVKWLEEQGAIAWLIPDFGPLMTLIPYDAAHDFTVGAHSLRVIEFLDLLRKESESKYGALKKALSEVTYREVLYLAGLVHDIGKQWPDRGGHSDSGAAAARGIAERLGWDTDRIEKLVFLVKNHLLMAETSRLRDITLDETVLEFIRIVRDVDNLNMLFLLTYADTTAVGTGVWTEVHNKFLTELYFRSEAILSEKNRDGDAPAFVPNITRHRERIKRQLALHNIPADTVHEHTRNLPAQYLLNTPLEDMYLHIAMIGRLRETYQPIIDFKHDFGSEFTELTICAFDDPKPGLLAKITGVLYAHDINVHVAQVFTREASVRIAIDTVWADFRGRPLTAGKKGELQESFRKVLTGEQSLDELLTRTHKTDKQQVLYSAKIDDKTSDRFSVLEISAPDEKGTLFRLANAISALEWNIHAARLAVWGSRARDAFYVTAAGGGKIAAQDVSNLLALLPTASFSKRNFLNTASTHSGEGKA